MSNIRGGIQIQNRLCDVSYVYTAVSIIWSPIWFFFYSSISYFIIMCTSGLFREWLLLKELGSLKWIYNKLPGVCYTTERNIHGQNNNASWYTAKLQLSGVPYTVEFFNFSCATPQCMIHRGVHCQTIEGCQFLEIHKKFLSFSACAEQNSAHGFYARNKFPDRESLRKTL